MQRLLSVSRAQRQIYAFYGLIVKLIVTLAVVTDFSLTCRINVSVTQHSDLHGGSYYQVLLTLQAGQGTACARCQKNWTVEVK